MNIDQAIDNLYKHASPVSNHPEWSKGLAGLLKPYRGHIPDEVFLEIIESLSVVFDHMIESQHIHCSAVAAMHVIGNIPQNTLATSESPIRSLGRISEDDAVRILKWVEIIEELYFAMLWTKFPKDQIFNLDSQLSNKGLSLNSQK